MHKLIIFPKQLTRRFNVSHCLRNEITSTGGCPLKSISCEEYNAFESKIDTEYFGISAAKATLKKACPDIQKQISLLNFLADFEFASITNNMNNPTNNLWLGEKTKAFLVDLNVQLEKKVTMIKRQINSSIIISDNLPKNDQVVHIAETTFEHSKFLHDPYLDPEKARRIYGDITKNAFGKAGRFFVIFNYSNTVGGFLLFSMETHSSCSTIDLIAVSPYFQRRGIGWSLIQAMESYVHRKGIITMKVGTQLNNIEALNFYSSYGFKYFTCSSIYHYWPSKP